MNKKINLDQFETIAVKTENYTCSIELNRPTIKNAFNDVLIRELASAFRYASQADDVRLVVFSGRGDLFCAGGDLNWMQRSINLNRAENLEDTTKLTDMFETLNSCTKPVVGLIHGAAIGGGVGLVSICDYVVAETSTVFSLSEVRLGIIPACIGPFVLAKIGESHARALFMSAERFKAPRAYEIGLVHELATGREGLEAAKTRIVSNLLQCGPNAMKAAKALIAGLRTKQTDRTNALCYVAEMLADLRVTPEGQEGLKAFLEKRKPNWII